MAEYSVSSISKYDKDALSRVDDLLRKEGIKRDRNLDYTCGVYDEDYSLIATGSAFGNTLRCFAVSSDHQGEGLMNTVMSHLLDFEMGRGISHVFVYTKAKSAKFFMDMGFYEIARVEGLFVFLENRKNGFPSYLENLAESAVPDGVSGAVVMNANPFTKGHRYLIEKAASQCDTLHVFVVSEDKSLVPFSIRKRLVEKGIADLGNVVVHESGPYMISNATFPSYFIADEAGVMEGHARLDVNVFKKIAGVMNITKRFVGDEPFSAITSLYNRVLSSELPRAGIECCIIPRLEEGGVPVSASNVRLALQNDDWDTLEKILPQTSLDFFRSGEAGPVIYAIKQEKDVIHH